MTVCPKCGYNWKRAHVKNILRDAEIVKLRKDGWTNWEVAYKFGISRERVMQIMKDYRRRNANT